MKKKIFIIILVIIILLLVLAAYLGYNHNHDNTNNEDNSITEIAISDTKVQELYSYLSDNKMFNIIDDKYKTVYQDKTITYSDLTKYNILRNTFYRLEKENAVIDEYNVILFSSNIFKVFFVADSSIIKFADQCATSKNDECIIPIKFDLNEVSGYYQVNCDDVDMCIWFLNGNDIVNDEPLYKLIKAEKSNNEYYLYDSVFYSDGKHLYDSYSKNNIIYTSPNDNLIDYKFVEENYKDYLFTYKHTYKQSGSGKYYWYSTELIK